MWPSEYPEFGHSLKLYMNENDLYFVQQYTSHESLYV